jgi:hypothetical protein
MYQSKHPLYSTYKSMRVRCRDQENPRYGGRGITVCDRWLENFFNFAEDMGPRPEGTTLDRIDNDLGYSPENCRWATPKEQNRNCARTKFVTYRGETKTLAEWCELLNFSTTAIHNRIFVMGWPIDEAFETPVRFKRTNRPSLKAKRPPKYVTLRHRVARLEELVETLMSRS